MKSKAENGIFLGMSKIQVQLPRTVQLKEGGIAIIRYAVLDDYPLMVNILNLAAPENSDSNSYWKERINQNLAFIAEVNSEIVAFATYDEPNELEDMAVLPRHQCKGIGSHLLALLEDIARSRGIKTVFINAAWRSESKWTKKGYERMYKDDQYCEDDVIPMKKDL